VTDKRINVSTQFGNHERNPMGHEATDEVYVSAEPVQLGNGYAALELLGSGESGLELRATVEGIRAFAGLDLNELTG
jgi:hypothetical protein